MSEREHTEAGPTPSTAVKESDVSQPYDEAEQPADALDEALRSEGETERPDDDLTGQDQDIAQAEVETGLGVAADTLEQEAEVESVATEADA